MVSRIKERLLQYKQELQKQTMYKEGLPGSSLDIVNSLLDDLEEDEKENGWIPVAERLPETDDYILVSFSNCTLSDIGRYKADKRLFLEIPERRRKKLCIIWIICQCLDAASGTI